MSVASTGSAPPEICSISLDQIQTDSGSQARVKVNPAVIREYANAMKRQLAEGGLRFPPIVLFFDGSINWVGDGAHRIPAARQAGQTHILAEVHAGTQRDALLYSISANSAHGLPRTNADKRNAVGLLLADAEWSLWSDSEVARHCQVHHTMVGRMRHGASCAKHRMRERTVRRGGTVYQMSLAAGETAATEQAPEPSPQAPPEHEPPDPAPEDPSVAHRSGGPAPAPTDPLGIPVPQERVPVFKALADFQEAKDLFGRLANLLDRIAQGPAGLPYRLDLIRKVENDKPVLACPLLRASLGKLQAAEPYCCECPGCHTAHPGRANPRCKTCTGRGWTTRAAYECSPATYWDAVLRLRKGNAK